MKTLHLTCTLIGALVSGSVFAAETGNVEQVTEALVKQQHTVVSDAVAQQVNQDILFALRTMQLPAVNVDNSMVAKVDVENKADTRGE
ncbi:hypothetical protein ACFSJY_03695 [Thalassotalea euphylliae]|uniref:hypothetical protein n=1 Tax=Thalassotalea euphylliae TaxID=1655234 RepID=UPI00364297B8